MKRHLLMIALSTVVVALGGAQNMHLPFQPVFDRVDLDRFMGSWYVIGVEPTVFEKGAVNGVETYSIDASGTIHVQYVFRKGSPSGKTVTMRQRGWVVDKVRNSEWAVQPLWPFRLPYLILELADDYHYTVIGTNNYKNVWIMARTPTLPDEEYGAIFARLEARGYNGDKILRMQQSW